MKTNENPGSGLRSRYYSQRLPVVLAILQLHEAMGFVICRPSGAALAYARRLRDTARFDSCRGENQAQGLQNEWLRRVCLRLVRYSGNAGEVWFFDTAAVSVLLKDSGKLPQL